MEKIEKDSDNNTSNKNNKESNNHHNKDIKELSKLKISIELFKSFAIIGLLTIGGGLVMLPFIEREFVEKKKWLDKEQMIDIFTLAQSVPGIIAINASSLTGYRLVGTLGAIASALGVILPSFTIIVLITPIFYKLQSLESVTKAFMGIRVAIIIMLFFTFYRMAKSTLKNIFSIVLFILSLIAIFVFNLNLMYIVLGASVLGLVSCPIKAHINDKASKEGK